MGRRVVVTRARTQASGLCARLRELGATVVEVPVIKVEPPESYAALDTALASLGSYDWLLVTSANTARVLGERIAACAVRTDRQPRTLAVGPATAAALRAVGLRVDLQPQDSIAEAILVTLGGAVAGQRVLLPQAAGARDLLPAALAARGALVTRVEAYRTVLDASSEALVRATFGPEQAPVDALTFTSSSTVTNLAALLSRVALPWPPEPRVLSIGPITSATLREHGVAPDAEAGQHDVEGLVKVVLAALA